MFDIKFKMPNITSQSQYAKNQVGGAEDTTINNFY